MRCIPREIIRPPTSLKLLYRYLMGYTPPMEMPLSEVVDRYSILLLKKERLPENEELKKECSRFEAELSRYKERGNIEELIAQLKEVNGQIWDLESDIRKGKEGELGLEEVGRRALAIRELNAERIRRKNRIAAERGEFVEVKVDHGSVL